MRELKPLGVDFITRVKLAKALVRGFGVEEVLRERGFKVVNAVSCCDDRCDPYAHVTFEKDGVKVCADFGVLRIPKLPIS
jgi:hypothetical protein